MVYQMAATIVTLNDLERYSSVAGLSNAIRRTFVQHFTRLQLTACSHGSSASAELFVNFGHSGTLALSPERQSARMSETKNGKLNLGLYGKV